MTLQIDTVWLDLDDTLWDFHANSRATLATLYDTERLDQWFSSPENWRDCYERHNHALWDQYNRAEVTKEFLMIERFRRPLVEGGCPEETAETMQRTLDKLYLSRLGECGKLVPGALELLNWLKENGYRTGVLSNGFVEVQHRKLHSSGVDHLIDCVVLSDEIGVNKPARQLFDYALEKSGTTADKSLLVGDNPSTDIAGAVNAGWHAVYFNRDGMSAQLPAPLCDHVPEIKYLDEVIPLLTAVRQEDHN